MTELLERARLDNSLAPFGLVRGGLVKLEADRGDRLRSREKGKLAELLVLSKNYFDPTEVRDDEISTVRSLLTMVGGKITFPDAGFAFELRMQRASEESYLYHRTCSSLRCGGRRGRCRSGRSIWNTRKPSCCCC